MKFFLSAWAVLLFSLSARAADCPLTLGASDTGWYNAANFHDPANNNYLVGYHTNSMAEYRDWFVFDLPSFTSPIATVELRLFTFSCNSADGMETLEMHDVATPITTLVAGAGPGITNVFNDLADGTVYGTRAVLVSEANSFIKITLNSNAVSAVSAAAGQRFAIGGRLSSLSPMPTNDERLFAFSSGAAPYVELVLTFGGSNAPVIFEQPPATVLLSSGGATNISVGACGTSPLRYRWFVNGSPMANQTNSTLSLVNVSPAQTGDYFAVVTNALGATTSSVAHVYVDGTAPMIMSGPSATTAAVGFPVSFAATVSASPPAALQWQFNGANISGATNSYFTLPSVQLSDAGTYTFVASNAFGMTNRSTMLLVEPLLIDALGNYQLDSGNDFYFSSLIQSSVPVTYQWRFNGTNLPGANSAYLSLFNVSSNDNGAYDLIVANTYGTRTSTVGAVSVLVRAPLSNPPYLPSPVLLGSDIIAYGDAVGAAPISLQWLFNNVPIEGATNLQLVLRNVSNSNAGGYSLVRSNIFGVSTSAMTTVVVITQPPTYTAPGTYRQVFARDTVRFTPGLSGGPRPTLQWQFNGSDISGATNASLLLTNLTVEQTGSYIINVSNQFGTTAVGFGINVKPRRALDRWTWRNSRPQANDLKHIAFGNGRTVAGGEGGSIATSTNGIDWTVVPLGNQYLISRVTFGNGRFAVLASSDEAVVFTSTDGLNWTAQELPFAYGYSLDFVNGEFLMAGSSLGTPILLARSSDATAWQVSPMAGPSSVPTGIAYGNGTYVAINQYEAFDSRDSVVWRRRFIPSSFIRVTFVNGLFAIAARSGEVWLSADGEHWFARNTRIVHANELTGDVNGVAYGNGQFVAVGDDGVIVRSLDTITWAAVDSTTSKNLRDVVFDGTKFIACGLYGALLTSVNDVTWTDRRGGKTKDLYGIIYTNGQFVAVGYEGTILTSPNGATWTTRSSPNSRDLHAVTYGGGQYVAVGRKGTVLTSPNAINWTSRTTPTTNYLQRVAWGNGRYVAVGSAATIVSSADGINWQLHANNVPASTELEGVAFGKGVFSVVGGYFAGNAHSVMLASTNGMNWSNVSLDVGVILRGVTFAFNNFLGVGNDGEVIFSGSGLVWNFPTAIPPFENLRHAKVAAGRAVAVGNDGTILSYNLYNWEQHGSIVAHNLHDVAYGAGKFVAVGNAGAIVQSDDVLPVFSMPSVSGSAVHFSLRGGMETEYTVQSTENFLGWENDDVFTNNGAPVSFSFSTNGPQRFFRTTYP